MKHLSRILLGWANLIRLPAGLGSRTRHLIAALSLFICLALVAYLLIHGINFLPARFWQLLALCAIALAVLWWFMVGAQKMSRRGFSRQRISDLQPGNPEQEKENLNAMQEFIRLARQTIQRSPEMAQGRDPLYRIPWVLFVGDENANVHQLLQSASQVSPFPAPTTNTSDAVTPVWQWWFFKSLIAIETAPYLVCDTADHRARGLWYHALLQLAQQRDKQPLNGIAVCVDASTLLASADQVKQLALKLRRLVDEALEHLRIQVPIYLIVNGIEKLPGYSTFRSALAPEVLQQAMGHLLEIGDNSSGGSVQLQQMFTPIVDRLHALRLTALRQVQTPSSRRALFRFVEAFKALEDGLQPLVQGMLEDNPFQRKPYWRGLYFTAAQQGADKGGFTADLFTQFLPADQPLASPNFKAHTARLGVSAIGVLAMLGFSVLLSTSLKGVQHDDSALLAKARAACQEPSDSGASSRISWVARCGQTVEQLEAALADSKLGFGLRKADSSIESTKATLLRDFSNLILAPYDQTIEADLSRNQTTVEHLLAVTQRLRLLKHCRKRAPECTTVEMAHNTVFDPRSRLFSPFISGDSSPPGLNDAQALFATYLGYLRWQSSDLLNAETQHLQHLLDQLLAAHTVKVEQLKQWVDAREDPLLLQNFWLASGRTAGTESTNQAAVSALFTSAMWQGYVQPLLDTVKQNRKEQVPAMDALRSQYLTAYMQAWGQFNARFHEGMTLWKGNEKGLTALAFSASDNPYERLSKALDTELLQLPLKIPLGVIWKNTWSQSAQSWLGAWRPVGRYIGQFASSLGNRVTSPWWTEKRVEPAPWIPAWMESRAAMRKPELRAAMARSYVQLSESQDDAQSYKITAALFAPKSTSTPSQDAPAGLQDYQLLLQATESPPEPYTTSLLGEDLQAWAVSRGPVQLLLYLTLQRGSAYLQARWLETVYRPMKTLDPTQQRELLFGPQGRLAVYVKEWLTPFVSDSALTPRSLAGAKLTLQSKFLNFYESAQQQGSSQVVKSFAAANLEFRSPSQFGNQNEGAAGSQLDIICQDRTYSVSSQINSSLPGRVQAFWAPDQCHQARLMLALPDFHASSAEATANQPSRPPAEPAPRLTLSYQGPESFLALARDFRTGSHSFGMQDFQNAYTPAQWAQIKPLLTLAGITQAKVFLQVTLTPEMERYLTGTQKKTELPERIFDF